MVYINNQRFNMKTENTDIRWEQRFSNYKKALIKLSDAVQIVSMQLANKDKLDSIDSDEELMREGLIKRFEYTHELAWNVMKDYAVYQGYDNITGSRDAIRQAISMEIVNDKRWMNTIADRNRTSHTYDDETAYEIVVTIIEIYYPLFSAFETKMEEIKDNYTSK